MSYDSSVDRVVESSRKPRWFRLERSLINHDNISVRSERQRIIICINITIRNCRELPSERRKTSSGRSRTKDRRSSMKEGRATFDPFGSFSTFGYHRFLSMFSYLRSCAAMQITSLRNELQLCSRGSGNSFESWCAKCAYPRETIN